MKGRCAAPLVTQSAPAWSPTLVQRKCSCGGSAGLSGECEQCASNKLTGSVQPKLVVGRPNDRFEREADAVSKRVLQAESLGLSPGPEADSTVEEAERLAQLKPERIQRQEEEETEEGDETAVGTLAVGPEEEDEFVQPKAAPEASAGSGKRTPKSFEDDLRRNDGTGSPLPSGLRSRMETAFGADFGRVRIHAGDDADRMSSSIRAHAFTVGSDIYFRRSRFEPTGASGRLLLAHELTHVVQQNPSVRVSPAADTQAPVRVSRAAQPVVQRDDDDQPAEPFVIGVVHLLDSNGNEITDLDANFVHEVGEALPPGIYDYKIRREDSGFVVNVNGKDDRLIEHPSNLGKLLPKIAQSLLIVADTKKGISQDQPDLKAGAGGQKEEGEEGEAGEGGGSKYGVFGLLKLPPWLTKALEKLIAALGHEEEMLALSELLRALRDLEPHLDKLKELFDDPEKLLRVALGLEELPAALENWVNQPATKRRTTARKKHTKGIAGLAKKVLGLLSKVKGVLRPIFKARQKMQEIFGLVGGLVFAAEGLEEIVEMAKDQKSAEFQELVESFSRNLSGSIKEKLAGLQQIIKLQKAELLESELVQYEELARVITAAILQIAPRPVKWAIKGLRKVTGGHADLERAIADNFVAKIIPKSALDAVNSGAKDLLKKLDEAFIASIEADLNKILASAGQALETGLIPEIKDALLQLDPRTAGGAPPPEAVRRLASLRARNGRPLPEEEKRELQDAYSYDLSRVKIFDDGRAHAAAASLQANAFTLGPNIFFAQGIFQPGTPEGRRILAHELTHVGQQIGGQANGCIQRDYKSVLDDLVKAFGKRITSSLIEIKGRKEDPKQKEAAEKILVKVKALIDQPVRSKTNPNISARTDQAYSYVLNSKDKPKGIRRKTKWLGLLPALNITSKSSTGAATKPGTVGYIREGFLRTFDPKSRDRAALRKSMNCKRPKDPAKQEEAHHVVPLEKRNHPIVDLAEKNGFGFNSKANGKCLRPATHKGSHPKYSRFVENILDGLLQQHPDLTWTPELKEDFNEAMKDLHSKVDALNSAGKSIESIK